MTEDNPGQAVIVEDLLEMIPSQQSIAVAIGVFDGVHLGHQTILAELCQRAHQTEVQATVLTFVRHPADVLAAEHAPKHICSLDDRVCLLQEACPGNVIVARFDHKLAMLSPGEFVDRVLVERLLAKSVIVGRDFHFGKNRVGDVHKLTDLCSKRGISVVVVPALEAYGAVISSTRIRKVVDAGDVEMAAKLLGRPFSIEGQVIEGEGIGRQLGFPTANIDTEPMQLIPKPGIYTADAMVHENWYRAVINVDIRPQLRTDAPVVEVHIIGFENNIYGELIRVEFKRRLRGKIRFEDKDSLIAQIGKDTAAAAEDPGREIS